MNCYPIDKEEIIQIDIKTNKEKRKEKIIKFKLTNASLAITFADDAFDRWEKSSVQWNREFENKYTYSVKRYTVLYSYSMTCIFV